MLRAFLIRFIGFILLPGIIIVSSSVYAKQEPLPTPLDIDTALGFAKDHPRTRLTAVQQLTLLRGETLFLNCHDLTFNNTTVTDNNRNSVSTNLINPVDQQKLFILQYFFDVLLADSSLIGVNEDMAGAFIDYDRAKIRQEFKQYSELRVARLEAEYQLVLQQRFSAEAAQRLTRSQLAQAINHPDDLSSDLIPITLIKSPKTLPEPEELYTSALAKNNWIASLKKKSNPAKSFKCRQCPS